MKVISAIWPSVDQVNAIWREYFDRTHGHQFYKGLLRTRFKTMKRSGGKWVKTSTPLMERP